MPGAHFDRALTLGAARLVGGNTKNTELQPMLSPNLAHDLSYRRLWTLFTLILAYSRWSCVGPKADRQIKKLTLAIHLMEIGFFARELSVAVNPSPKMYGLLAICTIMPSFLISDLFMTRNQDDKK
ncbi:Hypothetical Protein FCC1311_016762 [Hondaea fermentalgiana]|uniref:Uncharacterized protein n=1 Tax=Hondaea fermentalgiana TaxID=2315210 RepID=A0A2R5G6N9_9STRA|nr:Hypothetical Protein FCC1311_016762 [Hondaea fermentalgiana]|eukprot:GBG25458.1 Hypothetical Protein FCC1311_016762 [Hondaea fermentalgiana]